MRIIILLLGVLVYLFVMLLFGKYAENAARLSKRLTAIERVGQIDMNASDELERSFLDRFLKPGTAKIISYIGAVIPMNLTLVKELKEQLRQAGIQQSVQEYIAVHISLFGLSVIGAFLFGRMTGKTGGELLQLLIGAVAVVYIFSRFHLSQQITQRKNKIENQMPDVLDLLSVSVSAGLGFDQALLYVTERCKGPLIDELKIVQKEIVLGRTRSEALKQMADRCAVEPLNMFVSAIIQAETLGIAIANVLKTQADSIRTLHKEKIEEKAAKLPVKILIPLVLLIFPNIFVIILGPAVPRIVSAFAGV